MAPRWSRRSAADSSVEWPSAENACRRVVCCAGKCSSQGWDGTADRHSESGATAPGTPPARAATTKTPARRWTCSILRWSVSNGDQFDLVSRLSQQSKSSSLSRRASCSFILLGTASRCTTFTLPICCAPLVPRFRHRKRGFTNACSWSGHSLLACHSGRMPSVRFRSAPPETRSGRRPVAKGILATKGGRWMILSSVQRLGQPG
mmetsp:Transcript_5194/g.12303  ORF Transcript_5194/g.12303 Transcript_5194/m.12303 type:complete len:205 (+) Transcript_5194:718-1332(+)